MILEALVCAAAAGGPCWPQETEVATCALPVVVERIREIQELDAVEVRRWTCGEKRQARLETGR